MDVIDQMMAGVRREMAQLDRDMKRLIRTERQRQRRVLRDLLRQAAQHGQKQPTGR